MAGTEPQHDDGLLTIPEVATLLRMSEAFVRDELVRAKLRGFKIGGAWRVDRADLRRYVDAHANVRPVGRRARRRGRYGPQ